MQKKECILLITSTIAPAANIPHLKVIDPKSRLAEYCHAFYFYVNILKSGQIDRIVYADNSGYPLDKLQAIAEASGQTSRIEFISFRSDDDISSGRYAMEMSLIDTAFGLSMVLNIEKEQIVWKVTGRYIVANIAKIINTSPESFDLYVNCRNYPIRFLDFFLVAFRSQTYPRLLGFDIKKYRSQDVSGEIILRHHIDRGAFKGLKVIKRFKSTPRLTGGSRGYDGGRYTSPKETTKYYLRRVANLVVPSIWL